MVSDSGIAQGSVAFSGLHCVDSGWFGLRFKGLEFGVQGLRRMVYVLGSGFRVHIGLRVMVRVKGPYWVQGLSVEGLGCIVKGFRGGRNGLLLHRNVQRFRGGLVFKAHRRCVSLNSRLESNKEEKEGLQ